MQEKPTVALRTALQQGVKCEGHFRIQEHMPHWGWEANLNPPAAVQASRTQYQDAFPRVAPTAGAQKVAPHVVWARGLSARYPTPSGVRTMAKTLKMAGAPPPVVRTGDVVCTRPLCDILLLCCSFTGHWTVTRSSLRMLRRGAAFCQPLRPVLLLVSFPPSRSPVDGVLGLLRMWRDVPFPPPPPRVRCRPCFVCLRCAHMVVQDQHMSQTLR